MTPEEFPRELIVQVLRTTPAGMALLGPDRRAVFVNPSLERLTGRASEDLVGGNPLDLVHPEDLPALALRLDDRGTDPRVRTNARWIASDGSLRDTECLTIPVEVGGDPWTLLVALDVTPARKLAFRTASLTRFASALALAGSLPESLDALAHSVVEATGARACSVLLLERPAAPGEGVPTVSTVGTCNLPEEFGRLVEALWRSGEPLAPRQALATGRTVVGQCPPVAEALGVEVVASVPMRSGGRIVGIVNCLYPTAAEVDEAELTFIETLAPLAAVVAENARLFEQVRETVSTEERQHLARELHDSVSQSLYGIGLGARTALKLLDSDPARAAEPLQYVLSLAERSLDEMRALLFELRPESLQTDGLVGALRARARSLGTRHRMEVALEAGEEPDVSLDVKHCLHRIASEATHNVVKHAEARRILLRLSESPEEVRLEVEDDGRGFLPGGAHPGGLGLRSMQERAESLGGRLEVFSEPGRGTRVVALVPR